MAIASNAGYRKGLSDFGNGCYGYFQPDGSWGWSNAGLIVDSGASLLVDTLFDLKLTGEMLAAMRAAEPKATAQIDALVNTHSNGDHTFGNQLVGGAEIIASKACAEEMIHDGGAQRLAAIRVGTKTVRLIQVGPAHTRGDVLVYVPADRVLFTGDMLFIEGHPVIWAGPVGNWIKACQLMLDLEVETIVPGHGPLTDKKGVAAVKGYFEYIEREARRRFDAGMPYAEAARDIALTDYSSWGDAERIVVNVFTLYREFEGGEPVTDIRPDLFGLMAELRNDRRK